MISSFKEFVDGHQYSFGAALSMVQPTSEWGCLAADMQSCDGAIPPINLHLTT